MAGVRQRGVGLAARASTPHTSTNLGLTRAMRARHGQACGTRRRGDFGGNWGILIFRGYAISVAMLLMKPSRFVCVSRHSCWDESPLSLYPNQRCPVHYPSRTKTLRKRTKYAKQAMKTRSSQQYEQRM